MGLKNGGLDEIKQYSFYFFLAVSSNEGTDDTL